MKNLNSRKLFRRCFSFTAPALFTAALVFGVTPNQRTFTADQEAKVQGVIVSRDGQQVKLRAEDDSIGTIDLTDSTKIQLKHGLFGRKTGMDVASLVPGLRIEAQGKGNEKGELVADRVIFDPNSMRASRQIDTRVSPLEAKEGTLEGRTGTLEGRTGKVETRQGELEGAQKQTEQQVGQVQQQAGAAKTAADQANQGVDTVNTRVTNLDNYQPTDNATIYFKLNSATLSPQAKKDLDDLAQKALAQKGYVIEVAGYADKTGTTALNQVLSEKRADAVTRYLEQEGNIPIHRILTPTGMGISHEAAANNTAQGRKMNRRVEVKVLVNQGVVAGSSQPSTANGPKPPGQANQ